MRKYKSPFEEYDSTKRKKKSSRARFEIKLDAYADKDIIRRLDDEANMSDYVRQLIRQDIKKRGH